MDRRDTEKFLDYAPLVLSLPQRGRTSTRISALEWFARTERRKRIGNSQMNRFLKRVDFDRALVHARQQVNDVYMTQAPGVATTFILSQTKT